MTKSQMMGRIEEWGGKSRETCIRVTVEKFQEMIDDPEIMKELFRDGVDSPHFPFVENCGLCLYFQGYKKEFCPLKFVLCVYDAFLCCMEYGGLKRAILAKNKDNYIKYCKAIIDKIEETQDGKDEGDCKTD